MRAWTRSLGVCLAAAVAAALLFKALDSARLRRSEATPPPAARARSPEPPPARAPAQHARAFALAADGPQDLATAQRLGAVLALAPEGDDLDDLVFLVQRDPDARVRETAAIALAYADDARAIDALIAATRDEDLRVALSAIETLAWSEDRQARATLESLAGSHDASLAAAAARALTLP